MYREVAGEQKGIGILFLVLTTVIISIPTIFMAISQDLKKEKEMDLFFGSAAEFDIKDGKLIFGASAPVYFPAIGNPAIVIDPNGDATPLDKSGKIFLITKDKLIYKLNKNSNVHTLDLSTFQSKPILIETIKGFYGLGEFKKMTFPLFVFFSNFFYRLLWVAFCGVMAFFLQKLWKQKMTFKQLVRLAVIANTPFALLISALYLVMPTNQMLIFEIGSIFSLVFYFIVIRLAENA
jgi:hypothetical protein